VDETVALVEMRQIVVVVVGVGFADAVHLDAVQVKRQEEHD